MSYNKDSLVYRVISLRDGGLRGHGNTIVIIEHNLDVIKAAD